jgi:hypothetical protein
VRGLLAGAALACLLSSCAATQRVRFDPWRGMPAGVSAQLQQGNLPFSKDEVFRAAGEVLDHEPFLSWEILQQDPKAALVEATASSERLIQIRLADAPGDSGNAMCRLSLDIPQKPILGQKSVWISRADSLIVSAYDIEFSKREPWTDVTAAFALDRDYVVSAIYRYLTDRSAVPFSLEANDGPSGQGQKP